MKKIINKLDKKKIFYLTLALVFIMMLVLNYFTPLLSDDFVYSFDYSGKRIKNVGEIFDFQIIHYLKWGRSLVHFIAQVFLLFNKNVFNILNSLVYVLFTLLIYKHVVGKDKEYNWILYLIINFCLWFLLPAFGQNILWLVGACNYLWGATLVLLFLLPIRFYIDNNKYSNSIFLVIGMFLMGILAGWTNENNSAAMVVCVLLFLIYRIYNKQKIAHWHISGFIGALLGFLILILAPGNQVRSDDFANDFSFIKNIYNRFLSINNCFVEYLTSALIILIIISIIAYFHGKYKGKKILLNSIYVIGSFLGIYSMLLSPTFPDRAWMGPITFLIISIGYSYNCLNFKLKIIKKLQIYTISAFTIIFVISLYSSYIDIRGVYLSWNNRINSIKLNDKKDFEFDEIISYNKHTSAYGLEDIKEDPNFNGLVATYFNINSIKKSKK